MSVKKSCESRWFVKRANKTPAFDTHIIQQPQSGVSLSGTSLKGRHIVKNKLIRLYEVLYKEFGPQRWWPAKTGFEVIVGAILTQNTAWANVEKAIRNLAAAKLLTPSAMKKVPKKKLAGLIRPSGYYNVKAERLKSFLRFLWKEHNGSLRKMFSRDMETLRAGLLSVKGLGKETVDSILLYAGRKPVFVVDAYTKRILSRHNMAAEESTYDAIQDLFMGHLPHDSRLFGEYHALLVRLAKDNCGKRKPRCRACPARIL